MAAFARSILPLAVASAAAACAPVAPPGDDALEWAAIGETARTGPVSITPLSLVEDSRCPQGVECVWAGRVRVSARIEDAGNARTVTMTMGEPVALATSGSRGQDSVELVSTLPPARAEDPIAPGEYRFGFGYALARAP